MLFMITFRGKLGLKSYQIALICCYSCRYIGMNKIYIELSKENCERN